MMTAVVQTIHAQDAFVYSNLRRRRARTFTILFTEMAINTFIICFAHSPDGKTTQYTEHGARRTYETAIKTWFRQI